MKLFGAKDINTGLDHSSPRGPQNQQTPTNSQCVEDMTQEVGYCGEFNNQQSGDVAKDGSKENSNEWTQEEEYSVCVASIS